jgi:hypothetical protein
METKIRRLRLVGDPQVAWEFYRQDGWRWRQIDALGNVYKISLQAYRHLRESVAAARAEGYSAESEARFLSSPA